MKTSAVWLDRKLALISHYPREDKGSVFRALHSEIHSANSVAMNQDEAALYQLVALRLKDSADIMILGPDVAKHHFRNFLQEHHPLEAKKVVLFQAMDQPSERQLQSFVERFLWARQADA
jgi:hypothetical protein